MAAKLASGDSIVHSISQQVATAAASATFPTNARIAMPGGDWMWRSPDGFWRPDVRVQLVTDDDAVVLLHYRGLVQQTEALKRAASKSRETKWMDQHMRMCMTFDTGAEKYAWLNQSLSLLKND